MTSAALLSQIDTDLLPDGIQQLALIMGMDAAIQLVYAKPGIRLHIPRVDNLHPNHWLIQIVGTDAARALAEYCDGSRIEIPNVTSFERQLQEQQLDRMKAEGKSNAACALRLGLTERTIERKLAARRGNRQLDIFGDPYART